MFSPVTATSAFFKFFKGCIFNELLASAKRPAAWSAELACYFIDEMKKPEIARQLARRSRVSPGEAADRLDVMVRKIVRDLRKGLEPALPGLGKFKHGPDGLVAFERESRKRHG